MGLKLLHTPGSRSLRIIFLLEELGLDYELDSYKYDGAFFASSAFRKLSPMGKLPALWDDDAVIVESTAIMQYVLDRYGPNGLTVNVEDPNYAVYLQWFHMAEGGMANYIAVSFGHSTGIEQYQVSDAYDRYCRYQIEKALSMLEQQLVDRDYLCAQGFTAADISLFYTLFFAKFAMHAKLSERVESYFQRLLARDAAKKSLSDLPRNMAAAL